MATQAQVSAARYVAVPFHAEIVDAFGRRRSIIQCQQDSVDADFSQYHKFTTHAGFPIE